MLALYLHLVHRPFIAYYLVVATQAASARLAAASAPGRGVGLAGEQRPQAEPRPPGRAGNVQRLGAHTARRHTVLKATFEA